MKNKPLYFFVLLIFLAAISCGGDVEVLPDVAGDDTDEAIKLVADANKNYLRQIKKLYKENEGKVEDIKIAMQKQDVLKVRKIAQEAVVAIDEGIELGNSAIEKIEEAQELDINDNFREYLSLKEESLRKLVEGFRIRRELAKSFSQEFILSDAEKISKARAAMIEKEKEFHKIIKEGQEKSREANALAKKLYQEDEEF